MFVFIRNNWKGSTRPRLKAWRLRSSPSGQYTREIWSQCGLQWLCLFFVASEFQRARHLSFLAPFLSLFLHFSNFDSLFRKDLSVSQKECEEVKVRLRHREKQAADVLRSHGAPPVAGLCLKCAQHEAVLAGTHINLHVQAIDRLTKSVVTHTHKTFLSVTS